MMEEEIIKLAKWHADKIRSRDRAIKEEQEKLEQRLREIKAIRDAFVEKNIRADNYKFNSGAASCPVCYIEHGFSVEFTPAPGDEVFDKFKCGHCGISLDVQA